MPTVGKECQASMQNGFYIRKEKRLFCNQSTVVDGYMSDVVMDLGSMLQT